MPLFQCTSCGCVENTACSNYFCSVMDKIAPLCSECDPSIGKWHGRFEKRSAAGMLVDQSGHLWSQAQIEGNALPSHYTIMGKVFEVGVPAPPAP